MLKLAAEGLGDIVARPDPLRPEAADAVAAWNFCGGYFPERLPLLAEVHGLPDIELTIYLMGVISDQPAD